MILSTRSSGSPRTTVIALSAFLWIGAPAVAGPSTAGRDAGAALSLESCEPPGVGGPARCGSLWVAENPASPAGREIDLRVVKLPAQEGAAIPQPLFILAGGPGGAATQMAPAVGILYPDLRKRFDIVLVDRRGTGESNPLQCEFADTDSRVRAFVQMDIDPVSLARCREGFEADLTQYTTPIAVDDLDRVREALGHDRINLLGMSYGSRAALVYARRHPGHARTLVLEGVTPLSLRLPEQVAADAQKGIEDVWEECSRDEACRRAYPASREDLAGVLARLAGNPAKVSVKHPFTQQQVDLTVTAEVFSGGLRAFLYGNAFASAIPHVIDRARQGDFEPFATRAITFAEAFARTLHLGLYLSVVCTEDLPFVEMNEARAAAEGTFMGDALVRNHLRACEGWPRGELPPGYRRPVRSEIPTLLISGAADPVTGPRWGEEVARHLPNSRHLVIGHAGHSDAIGPCEGRIIAEFIRAGSLEGLDTSCALSPRERQFIVDPPVQAVGSSGG